MQKNALACLNLSTGTPGGRWQYRADHTIGQICRGGLNGLPGLGSFGFKRGPGLADLFSGSLAGSVQSGFALGIPLLDPLFANCVDLGARLAQFGGILGRLASAWAMALCAASTAPSVRARRSFSVLLNGPCTRNWYAKTSTINSRAVGTAPPEEFRVVG